MAPKTVTCLCFGFVGQILLAGSLRLIYDVLVTAAVSPLTWVGSPNRHFHTENEDLSINNRGTFRLTRKVKPDESPVTQQPTPVAERRHVLLGVPHPFFPVRRVMAVCAFETHAKHNVHQTHVVAFFNAV